MDSLNELLEKIKRSPYDISKLNKKLPDAESEENFVKERTRFTSSYVSRQKESTEEQKRRLREEVKFNAFLLLYIELFFLASVLILEGFGYKYKWFYLNDWVIGIFANACLFQTFLIIRYIAVNLFPNNNINNKKHPGETHIHHHRH